MTVEILTGDCRTVLGGLPEKSVHCCVTSPPYFGLRDYGTSSWSGGDPEHAHDRVAARGGRGGSGAPGKQTPGAFPSDIPAELCSCGAVRVDSQIGLEATPHAFVAQLVAVFREVRRALRDDGTLWLNLGDSYAGSWGAQGRRGEESKNSYNASVISRQQIANHPKTARNTGSIKQDGLKAKDLIGIPWRVAFALQADGWYLRQDIIWSKPNPMPESVTDRCTKAHEYIFLFSKSERYFYDADAVAEPAAYSGLANQDESGFKAPQSFNGKHKSGYRSKGNRRVFRGGGVYTDHQSFNNSAIPDESKRDGGNARNERGKRNKRSVWEVATAPYSEAHFATFPPALIEPCILASTSERGCCRTCGAGWIRCQDETWRVTLGWYPQCEHDGLAALPDYPEKPEQMETAAENNAARAAWAAACAPTTKARRVLCEAAAAVPTNSAVVLDPFGGAGTTGLVADRLQRSAVLVELNPKYADMARRRIHNDAPLFSEAAQ